jgi:hypothetical protein
MKIDKPEIIFDDYDEKSTPVDGDLALIADSEDNNSLKKVNVINFGGGGSSMPDGNLEGQILYWVPGNPGYWALSNTVRVRDMTGAYGGTLFIGFPTGTLNSLDTHSQVRIHNIEGQSALELDVNSVAPGDADAFFIYSDDLDQVVFQISKTGDVTFIGNINGGTFPTLPKRKTSLTLDKTLWELVDGLYQYTLTDSDMTINTSVEVVSRNSTVNIAITAQLLQYTDPGAGFITIYAKNAPTDDIIIDVIITKVSNAS